MHEESIARSEQPDIQDIADVELVTPTDFRNFSPAEKSATNSTKLEQSGVIPTLTLTDSTSDTAAQGYGQKSPEQTNRAEAGTIDSERDSPQVVNEDPSNEKSEEPKEDAKPEPKPEVKVTEVTGTPLGTVQERTRVINGVPVIVRAPIGRDQNNDLKREVDIGGERIKLEKQGRSGQKWFWSELKEGAKIEQVKLHVSGIDSEDVAKLQKELLPLLERMRKDGSVSQYKTYDPNYLDPEWANAEEREFSRPNGEGQSSKAFTIYLPTDKAAEVSAAIDRLLVEKNLSLPADHKTGTVGDYSRAKTESKRVSVERDTFEGARQYPGGSIGALLDDRLQKELTATYSLLGMNGKELSPEALRQIEKDAGLAPEALAYDRYGRLLMFTRGEAAPNGQYYTDESQANKTPGKLTGRPAVYALYEMMDLDPAKIKMEDVAVQKAAAKSGVSVRVDGRISSNVIEGLEAAHELAEYSGVEPKTPEQVKQLLKNTLEQMDKHGSWTETQRAEFVQFTKDYGAGVTEVVKATNKAVGLDSPALPKFQDFNPFLEESVQDLKKNAAPVERRTTAAADLFKEGPVKAALVKNGVEEERARDLAKDLVSADEERRERALREVASHYQTRGGIRSFVREAKGTAGAAAIVVGSVAPQILDRK